MAISLDWVEEVLCWVSGETNTMGSKLRKVVDPDQYRGSDAIMLTAKTPSFFEDLKILRDSLQDVSEIASRLAATLDSCAEDKEKEKDNG
jgi:hypothetical protein